MKSKNKPLVVFGFALSFLAVIVVVAGVASQHASIFQPFGDLFGEIFLGSFGIGFGALALVISFVALGLSVVALVLILITRRGRK